MPWLIKEETDPSRNLFFVHVPRCGGTSLMKAHDVPIKVMENRSLWKRIGMTIFFRRYKLLEKNNFPIKTKGNAVSSILFLIGIYQRFFRVNPADDATFNRRVSNWLIAISLTFFLSLTFIFTAPTIGRIRQIRRLYLILVHYLLFRFMESIDWCTGTNKKGYINHLTAHKLLDYGYISPEQWDQVCSMAIVRNPYTRMVSIYMYNRFGPSESFQHFVRSWYKMLWHYRESGEMEEWYTPCHGIPQFEYTHFEGKQLVQAVVKQEELKFLKSKTGAVQAAAQDSSVKDLPEPVLKALLGMPHANARKTTKPWWEYYDQETLNLTYELYQHDFDVFQYSPVIKERPDLASPEESVVSSLSKASHTEPMRRDSVKSSAFSSVRREVLTRAESVTSRRTSMRRLQNESLTTQLGGKRLRTSIILNSSTHDGVSASLLRDSYKITESTSLLSKTRE